MANQQINAGSLRHLLRLQNRSNTTGSRGQNSATYADVADVWGSVQQLSGRELEVARQLNANVTSKVVIRYHPLATVQSRFVFGSRTLNVEHIDNVDNRNRLMICLCQELL